MTSIGEFRDALRRATEATPTGVKWLAFLWANTPFMAWYLYRQQPGLAVDLYRLLPSWTVPACVGGLIAVMATLATIWIRRVCGDWPPIIPIDYRRKTVEIRSRRQARAGFTLIEMLVSVVLVMLMMLMFAQIYGMATEIISKQKGIAENNQKARILAQVMRQDLETRTFRSVYPFKIEMDYTGTPTLPVIENGMPSSHAAQVLAERLGYFAFSENDPADDTDDTLSLTVDVGDPEHGTPGRRLFGKASAAPMTNTLPEPQQDGPEYDDGRLGDASGSSSIAEVTYFLRYGNLYRSTLLIRQPYLEGDDRAADVGRDTPTGFPADYSGNFWADFDYSAYREKTPTETIGLHFHGQRSLSNDPDDNPATAFPGLAPSGVAHIPRSLGVPQLRFGHTHMLHGQPLEFSGTLASSAADTRDPAWRAEHEFFARLTTQERSASAQSFPGQGSGPFASGVPYPADPNADGIIDIYEDGGRRGVDLMLPNVHGFDVQVWDDIVGDYVDLGHDRMGINPYLTEYDDENNPIPQVGFYHASRLRRAWRPPTAPLPNDNFHMEHSSLLDGYNFGNRYDTWSPNMWIEEGGFHFRLGRAPYRPMQANPDPNTTDFNRNYERLVSLGDNTLNDNGDATFMGTDDNDAEAPLRAIRIVVRYLDPQSGQTRQATIEQSLID